MHEYEPRPLRRSDLSPDPIEQFARWFDDATRAVSEIPEGVALATAGSDGQPSIRTVLLKSFGADGFVFFTNYDSRKGRELEMNPRASLLFWWRELSRQIRIEGHAEKVPAGESDAYFATRPRGSKIAAWVSEQSSVIASREVLENGAARLESLYDGIDVSRPPHWGGYRLVPRVLEFWQGQPSRLHDRFAYILTQKGEWQIERLAP